MPEKAQITYPNGNILLERKDGTIRILTKQGLMLAAGTITERMKDGTVFFKETVDGMQMRINPDGAVDLGVLETQSEPTPRPNIR